MSVEGIFGLEYIANEQRLHAAASCLELLVTARVGAPPCVVEHLDRAIAAAVGARAGYSYRDDELYIAGKAALDKHQ